MWGTWDVWIIAPIVILGAADALHTRIYGHSLIERVEQLFTSGRWF